MTVFHDPAAVKLGRAPKRVDKRTFKLTDYVPVFPPIPPAKNWGDGVSNWGMMKNDMVGDCAFAGMGHIIMLDTAANGNLFTPSDDDVIGAYSAVTGYVAGDESTDKGTVLLDALNYWRQTGMAGHKILAYASISPTDIVMMKTAIYLFGGIYVGVDLPITAQSQAVWTVNGDGTGNSRPGSWGGHCISLGAYDQQFFGCVTWGRNKYMTQPWWTLYGEEAYAVITEDWVPPAGAAPNSFNMDQLKTDLAAVTSKGGA
jgi:hypothetical protein